MSYVLKMFCNPMNKIHYSIHTILTSPILFSVKRLFVFSCCFATGFKNYSIPKQKEKLITKFIRQSFEMFSEHLRQIVDQHCHHSTSLRSWRDVISIYLQFYSIETSKRKKNIFPFNFSNFTWWKLRTSLPLSVTQWGRIFRGVVSRVLGKLFRVLDAISVVLSVLAVKSRML